MSELDDRLEELRKRHRAATVRCEQAEQNHAVAKAKEEAARAVLQEEFGVSTTEAAHELLAGMEAELGQEISKADALLREAESA